MTSEVMQYRLNKTDVKGHPDGKTRWEIEGFPIPLLIQTDIADDVCQLLNVAHDHGSRHSPVIAAAVRRCDHIIANPSASLIHPLELAHELRAILTQGDTT